MASALVASRTAANDAIPFTFNTPPSTTAARVSFEPSAALYAVAQVRKNAEVQCAYRTMAAAAVMATSSIRFAR